MVDVWQTIEKLNKSHSLLTKSFQPFPWVLDIKRADSRKGESVPCNDK